MENRIYLGSEIDDGLIERIKVSLKKKKAILIRKSSTIDDDRFINKQEFDINGTKISFEFITFVGIFIIGDSEIIEIFSSSL